MQLCYKEVNIVELKPFWSGSNIKLTIVLDQREVMEKILVVCQFPQ